MRVFLVGGAVRDQLMCNPSSDRDYVVVGSTPDEMLSLGYKKVGADFPVFLHPETGDEYALARTERKSGKGYLGFDVNFSSDITIEEDCSRRDLTINSMAIAEDGTLIDPFNGLNDINNKILRHTSSAFTEDPLRIIRLARFYARFVDFTIDASTIELAQQLVDSGELEHLSQERFWAELEKTFEQTSRIDRFIFALDLFGVLDKVLFFKDLFGEFKTWTLTGGLHILADEINNLNLDLRIAAFIALSADTSAHQKSQVIPLRVKKLSSNIRAIRMFDDNCIDLVKSVFTLLKHNRAFTSSGALDDLIKTARVGVECGESYVVSPDKLSHIQFNIAEHVSAADFPQYEGKALGEALDNARIDIIKNLIL